MSTGDQQLGEKCEVLQQKLDLLLHTLHKEESYITHAVESSPVIHKTETPVAMKDQEKGALEKPEKDITNLKRVRKKRNFAEREAVMMRYFCALFFSVKTEII